MARKTGGVCHTGISLAFAFPVGKCMRIKEIPMSNLHRGKVLAGDVVR